MEPLPAELLIDPTHLRVSDKELARGSFGAVFAGKLDDEWVCCKASVVPLACNTAVFAQL
jgi:hypothetical protein